MTARKAIFGGLAGLALFAALAIPSWLVPQAREQIGDALDRRLHHAVSVDGGWHLSLLPMPTVTLKQVHFNDPLLDMRAPALEMSLRLWPLLRGHFEIDSAQIEHPAITVTMPGDNFAALATPLRPDAAAPPSPSPTPAPAPVVESPSPPKPPAVTIGRLTVTDGHLAVLQAGQTRYDLDRINATLSSDEDGQTTRLAASGRGTNGGGFTLEASLPDGTAFDRGQPSRPVDIAVTLDQGGGDGRLVGQIALQGGHPSFTGKLSLHLAANQPFNPLGARALTVETTMTGQIGGDWQATDLTITLGGNSLQGDVAYRTSAGQPHLAIRLESDRLDLDSWQAAADTDAPTAKMAATAVTSSVTSPQAPAAGANGILTLPAWLRNAPDGTIDLAARQIAWHGALFDKVQLRASVADHRPRLDSAALTLPTGQTLTLQGLTLPSDAAGSIDIDSASVPPLTLRAIRGAWHPESDRDVIDLQHATLYGGVLAGTVVSSADGVTVLHLSVSHAQVKEPLQQFAGVSAVDGWLDSKLALTLHAPLGKSLATANGQIAITLHDGHIDGFDLQAVDDRLQKRDGAAALLSLLSGGLHGGRTTVTSLTATARLAQGLLDSDDIKLVAQGGGGEGTLHLDLPAETMESQMGFHLAHASDAPPLVLRLSGPWANPRRVIDVTPIQNWLTDHFRKGMKPKDLLKSLFGH